ncbi:MAG: fumarylacetoacetase [Bacteroidota bacterium]
MHRFAPNNPALKSWVDVVENNDFPIQNLPFGIYSTGSQKKMAVAIGDFLLDLDVVHHLGCFEEFLLPNDFFVKDALNDLIDLGREKAGKIRAKVADILSQENVDLYESRIKNDALRKRSECSMHLPLKVGDYTDFYSSEQHAINVGKMFRDPENPLLPNWKHIPVGYHGRASSIIVSGETIRRPLGQVVKDNYPTLQATERLDFELEMGFVTCTDTTLGSRISMQDAEEYIFGLVLLNDWSARDIQKWEYVPLGPFLGKNFATSISPWVVSLDALVPFKTNGTTQDPEPLEYLQNKGQNHYNIELEVALLIGDSRELIPLSKTNFAHVYWSMAQQLTHHTVNGCNIRTGDLYGSGTISGTEKHQFGSMLELSWNGQHPVLLPDGQRRTFLQDYDTVLMKGYSQGDGYRIGFGELENQIIPALPLS